MIATARVSDVHTHPDKPTEPRTFTTWRRHRCTRTHRDTHTWLRCALGGVEWITGRGSFAVVAYCRSTTVTVWPTADAARAALDVIDETGCCGRCTRRHRLIPLDTKGAP